MKLDNESLLFPQICNWWNGGGLKGVRASSPTTEATCITFVEIDGSDEEDDRFDENDDDDAVVMFVALAM